MVDNIVVVVDGEISETGSYEELLSQDKAFAQFLRTYLQQQDSEDEEDEECSYSYILSNKEKLTAATTQQRQQIVVNERTKQLYLPMNTELNEH